MEHSTYSRLSYLHLPTLPSTKHFRGQNSEFCFEAFSWAICRSQFWEVPFCRSDRSESPALPFVAKWLDDLSPGRLSGAARLRPPHLHCCSAREWKGSKRWIEGTEVCVGYSKSEAKVVSPRASLRLPTAHRCKMTVSGIPTCFCLCCVPRPCLCTPIGAEQPGFIRRRYLFFGCEFKHSQLQTARASTRKQELQHSATWRRPLHMQRHAFIHLHTHTGCRSCAWMHSPLLLCTVMLVQLRMRQHELPGLD